MSDSANTGGVRGVLLGVVDTVARAFFALFALLP